MLAKKVEELSLNPDFPADAKGIPKFWLHVLKNGNEEALMGLVEEHDEVVLENLTNITVALDLDNAGFTLTFHFRKPWRGCWRCYPDSLLGIKVKSTPAFYFRKPM